MVGVIDGVNEDVGVMVGVIDIVTDGVTDGVTDKVGCGVFDGVSLGVTDGVTLGVTDGDGVAPLTLSQQSSKLTLKTCSQQPSQSILTYISINVGSIPVISQISPVVIPVQDVTPVILVDVKPV